MTKNRRIKILFLIDDLLPGGTEKQLLFLAKSLPRNRFEPVLGVLYKNEYHANLKIKTTTINFNWTGPPFLKRAFLVWKLQRYLVRESFDIFQAHFIESHFHGALAVRLCRDRPIFIGTRRNLYHWTEDQRWSFYLLRYTARWSDRILVNSHTVFQECQRREGIPPEKITLIQNAVEVEKFNNLSSKVAKSNIGLAGEFPIIGVVSNWRPIKGLIPFLKGAVLVSQKIPSARFLLVGFGPQENELRSLVRDFGIHNRVTFLKYSSDIPSIMAAFDIAVQPSLSESFSNVLVEYMAASRPIVATRVGDAERIIEDGREGILVHPNNPEELSAAIFSLFHNQEKAANMGRVAREKVVANWASEKILNEYCQFYEEITKDI
jgi:glycosyltransferase involved in cell wall biosynthesis